MASKLVTLFDEASAQARRGALRALLAGLEHLLEQQQWARERLRAHAGGGLRVMFELPTNRSAGLGELRFQIDESGLLQAADSQGRIDVTLRFRASVDALFDLLAKGPETTVRHLRIDGDPALAATIGDLARYLRWEPEEDLSRLIGDAAAHRVTGVVRAGADGMREAAQRALASAGAWVAGDQQQLTTKPLTDWFSDQVSELSGRIADLELRASRLAARRRSTART
jgi:ubiquinone biosynthesis protein UbiJ